VKLDPNIQYPDPSQYAGFLVWQTANKLEKYINSQLKAFGLNQAEMLHLISLFHLLQTQAEVSQTQLADYTGVTTMSVSKIITKLEKLEYVTRSIGSDPRSKSVMITKSGFELLIKCATTMHQIDSNFFPAKSKQTFINYLTYL
jgi:DNA-binding MarR family transcriptional regulator